MKKINKNSTYKIVKDSVSSKEDMLNLIQFYMPIIGHKAFSTYSFLTYESFSKLSNLFFPIDRLIKSVQLSIDDLEDIVKTLIKYELISLSEKDNKITINLIKPKNKSEFLKNKEATNELELKITKDNMDIIKLSSITSISKDKKIDHLENIKPNSFIETIMNRKLSTNEKELIGELEKTFGLNTLQINLLLDYSYVVNGKLNLNYIKKMADTVLERNLKNKDDLMKFLKDNFNNKNKTNNTTKKLSEKRIKF